MPTAKITLTLAVDDEVLPEPEQAERAMAETLALLSANGIGPATKIVFTLAFDDEDDARATRGELRATLGGRPVGITADVKLTSDESVERMRMTRVTPMDQIQGFAEKHGASVEFVAGERTLRFDPQR